ncbi:MAG: hypothetical protein RL324_2511 [Verrucomicrobiota bacterium]|jgi:hypothetical protein
MKNLIHSLLLLGSAAALSAAAAEPASFADAISRGKFSVNARLRYESARQSSLNDANALTHRTRLGFAPATYHGWKAFVEAENIVAADGEAYSQAGLNPGGAGRAVVADPEVTELNQLYFGYTADQTTVTVGRQRLVLDNARFVGDVGWRQDMQTFDAVVVQDKSYAKTTLTYAYVDRVLRVFSRRHAQGQWDAKAHLFNASYAGGSVGTVTGYGYLMDFKNSAANSNATYGASLAGSRPVADGLTLTYRAEAAVQSDYGSSTLSYSANYGALEAGLGNKTVTLGLGYEALGSDNNIGFKTPLATLHAFNGWADLFLATPAAGLRDTYGKVTLALPQAVALVASYHDFTADTGGTDFGTEADIQLTRKFGTRFTAVAKYADFRRDAPAFPNVRKLWLQVDFAF